MPEADEVIAPSCSSFMFLLKRDEELVLVAVAEERSTKTFTAASGNRSTNHESVTGRDQQILNQ